MHEILDFFSNAPIDFLDWSVDILSKIEWYWVLVFALLVTFLENVFPPSPSDSILLFMGSLVVFGTIGFIPLLIFATIGSVGGFLFMYYLGKKFGARVLDSDRLKFITKDDLVKLEKWFAKWGYSIIVANRFLSGTRAVISFFAGMTKLNLTKTTILSAVSALAWNIILIYLGVLFADNLDLVKHYINLYGKIVFPIIFVILIILIGKWLYYKRKSKVNTSI